MCLKDRRLCSGRLSPHEFSMGKNKRSWFSWVKSLFVSDPKSKAEKKPKSHRRGFGGLKPKQYPTLAAPHRLIYEAREEQRKHVMAVAMATAAAAQAAVAAARAAAEIVQLTGVPLSFQEYEKRIQNSAAIKIQAAYRAHLARKALKALKGLVKLQAMVRGRIVRRRHITELKCFQPISKISQSHVQEVMRNPSFHDRFKDGENKQFLSLEDQVEERKSKLRCKSQQNFNCSLLFSKEEMENFWLQKQEATSKRDPMKKHPFSHRVRRNDQNMESGRWSNPIDQGVESESCRRRELKSTLCPNPISIGMYGATKVMKQRNPSKQDSLGDLNSPFSLPRRSFSHHAKHKSIGEEKSLPNSPNFPAYMAATESAKAKARSMSTPRQRLGFFDSFGDYNSPHKLKLSA